MLSLFLMLVLTELGLRLTGKFPVKDLHTVSSEDYKRIPGMFEPGQDFINLNIPALPYRIVINSLGLRGPETTLEPDKPRILFVGDSFTFGEYVNNDETLPAYVQENIKDQYEVLNGGVGGTTIIDQHVFIDRLLSLKPDVVVLVYCENDLRNLFSDIPMHEKFAKNRELKSGFMSPIFRSIRETCLFNLLLKSRGYINVLLESRLRDSNNIGKSENSNIQKDLTRLSQYVKEVVEIQNKLHAQGIEFLFVAYPSHKSLFMESREGTIKPLLSALSDIGIAGIDLSKPLISSGLSKKKLYLWPHDGHASSTGYEIASKVISQRLKTIIETRDRF